MLGTKDILMNLLKCDGDCLDEKTREILANKLLYYGVIVPPVKVGTNVWLVDYDCYNEEWIMHEVTYEERYVYHYNKVGENLFLSFQEAEDYIHQKKFLKTT